MRLVVEYGTVLKPDDLQTTIAKKRLEKSSQKSSIGSNDESANEELFSTRTPKASPQLTDKKLVRRPTIDVNEMKNKERYITVTDFLEII